MNKISSKLHLNSVSMKHKAHNSPMEFHHFFLLQSVGELIMGIDCHMFSLLQQIHKESKIY